MLAFLAWTGLIPRAGPDKQPGRRARLLAIAFGAWLVAVAPRCSAQAPPYDPLVAQPADNVAPAATPSNAGELVSLEPEPSSPSSLAGIPREPTSLFGLRISGWMDMGYTYSTSGAGRLAVAPELNRYGDEYLFNQLAVTLEKPLDRDDWSWGTYVQFFSGADASTLQGPGDIANSNARFGASLRQANFQAHLPIATEGGVDVVFGRQGSLMGYESYMAPQRSFYSLSYQWYFAEDGADTGCWTTWHAADDWDLTYGVYLGSNTLFSLRGDAPSQVLQAKQWLDDDHKLYHCGTLVLGDDAVGNTIPFLPGTFASVLEWRIQYAATDRLVQVFQANAGWDQHVRFVGTGEWRGVLANSVYRLDDNLDAQLRLEWFDDVNGTRTGLATDYAAVTAGLAARFGPQFTVRPELRGDFAGKPVFGPLDSLHRDRSQLTAALEFLWNF